MRHTIARNHLDAFLSLEVDDPPICPEMLTRCRSSCSSQCGDPLERVARWLHSCCEGLPQKGGTTTESPAAQDLMSKSGLAVLDISKSHTKSPKVHSSRIGLMGTRQGHQTPSALTGAQERTMLCGSAGILRRYEKWSTLSPTDSLYPETVKGAVSALD